MILSRRMTGCLGCVVYANRPGYVASAKDATVAALVSRGLVTARPDPTNADQQIVVPTAAGRKRLAEDLPNPPRINPRLLHARSRGRRS